jgi:uncharacterized membrane protein
MSSFSIWHWLITLMIVVAIPVLFMWRIFRASRGAERSTTARLHELAQLKEKGLVTEEEFERKRADLARRL